MPKNRLEIAAEQKITKPQIEGIANEYFNGEMKENALSFASYLRENKMKPAWSAANTWKSMWRSVPMCRVFLSEHESENSPIWANHSGSFPAWCVGIYLKHIGSYEETIFNEGLHDFIWNNVSYCKPCRNRSTHCTQSKDFVLLGKGLENVCMIVPAYGTIWVSNPDKKEIAHVKRLLELEQKAIIENKVPKKGE